MALFGTPGGTPLNTTPFQGTAPGNPAQATIQPFLPGVGLFPPNSNNLSGDSIQAACARAAFPANAIITSEGVGGTDTVLTGTPPLDDGAQSFPAGGIPFGVAPGGGEPGIGGVGGANMNANVGAVGDVVVGNQANPSQLAFQGGGSQPTQFAG